MRSFPISFDGAYLPITKSLRFGPSVSHVTVEADHVTVKMGWAFSARFSRSSIVGVSVDESAPVSRGVHGARGQWLVNGAGSPLVAIDLEPPARARVAVVPVQLRRVIVSTDQPEELMAALG